MKKTFSLLMAVFVLVGLVTLVGCNGLWNFDDDNSYVPQSSSSITITGSVATNTAIIRSIRAATYKLASLTAGLYRLGVATAVAGPVSVDKDGKYTITFTGSVDNYYVRITDPNKKLTLLNFIDKTHLTSGQVYTAPVTGSSTTAMGLVIQNAYKNTGKIYTVAAVKADNDLNSMVSNVTSSVNAAIINGLDTSDLTTVIKNSGISSLSVDISDVHFSDTTLKIVKGETKTVAPVIEPATANIKSKTFESDDTTIVKVGSTTGVITGEAVGSATVTVTAIDLNDNKKTATIAVSVELAKVAVTSVSVTPTTLRIVEGDSSTLTATVTPSNATDKTVTWTSSDDAVATVDSTGKVTAKSVGNANITVTTTDGSKTAVCAVTVSAVVGVKSVTFSPAITGRNLTNFQIVIRNVPLTYTNSVDITYTQNKVDKIDKFTTNSALTNQFKEVTITVSAANVSNAFPVKDISTLVFDSELPSKAIVAIYDLDNNVDIQTVTVP